MHLVIWRHKDLQGLDAYGSSDSWEGGLGALRLEKAWFLHGLKVQHYCYWKGSDPALLYSMPLLSCKLPLPAHQRSP